MQSQKAEAAVQCANRAGEASAPNTGEETIAARTTGIGQYYDDQRFAGAMAKVELARRRAEQKAKLAERQDRMKREVERARQMPRGVEPVNLMPSPCWRQPGHGCTCNASTCSAR